MRTLPDLAAVVAVVPALADCGIAVRGGALTWTDGPTVASVLAALDRLQGEPVPVDVTRRSLSGTVRCGLVLSWYLAGVGRLADWVAEMRRGAFPPVGPDVPDLGAGYAADVLAWRLAPVLADVVGAGRVATSPLGVLDAHVRAAGIDGLERLARAAEADGGGTVVGPPRRGAQYRVSLPADPAVEVGVVAVGMSRRADRLARPRVRVSWLVEEFPVERVGGALDKGGLGDPFARLPADSSLLEPRVRLGTLARAVVAFELVNDQYLRDIDAIAHPNGKLIMMRQWGTRPVPAMHLRQGFPDVLDLVLLDEIAGRQLLGDLGTTARGRAAKLLRLFHRPPQRTVRFEREPIRKAASAIAQEYSRLGAERLDRTTWTPAGR